MENENIPEEDNKGIIEMINPTPDNKREELMSMLDQKKIINIVNSLPERRKIDYEKFKEILKTKSEGLLDLEKSFLIYYWITNNISYDVKNILKDNPFIKTGPKEVFKTGSSISSGYSRLFRDLCLNLDVVCQSIKGYSKGNNFGEKILEDNKNENEENKRINHQYNVVKINDNWNFVDTALGSGYITNNRIFIKLYNEFYFLTKPSELIFSHFPEDEKWQLLEEPITEEDFYKGIKLSSEFFKYGFKNTNLEKSNYIIEQPNETVILEYDFNNKNHPKIQCNLKLNGKEDLRNTIKIFERENYFDIELEFKKPGIYKLEVLGNNGEGPLKPMMVYIFEYQEKTPKVNKQISSTGPYHPKKNSKNSQSKLKK